MKTNPHAWLAVLFFVLALGGMKAQNTPAWTRDINSLPDSASVFPVRVLNDDSNHVYVLSTYMKTMAPGVSNTKIYLNKYDDSGNLNWSLVYDHGGSGNPRGYDMVLDPAGNCYIAAGLADSLNEKPLLLKVTAGGSVDWERDSLQGFTNGIAGQIFIRNQFVYVRADGVIVKFDLNGAEQWSAGVPAGRMALDHAGQSIVVTHFGNPINIQRFDSSGTLNFSAVTITAKRIAVDSYNNFYLLTDNFPQYELVKYDSAGNFQWSRNNFTSAAPFGDIGFEVLTDYNDDVILVGLNDSIFKLSPSGNLVWGKPMNGLDSYLISAKITYSNLVAVAGSVPDSSGYNTEVRFYDLLGNVNWSGSYNGNLTGQEFAVDMTIDNAGVYVTENNADNTTLVKFASPFLTQADYSLVCVDSVWYDSLNPVFINVRVFNGNIGHLNYPSVQIVSPAGDTIGNPSNQVTFFAHLGNGYLIYTDTITVAGIPDFSNYTFLISEGFGDTTAVISWCLPQGIPQLVKSEIEIYPNPAHDMLKIKSGDTGKNYQLEIFNALGSRVLDGEVGPEPIQYIDLSGFASGMYFIRLWRGNETYQGKFIRQ